MMRATVEIDTESPPGAYRASNAPDATCAACKQTICHHPDAIYAGAVPQFERDEHADCAEGSEDTLVRLNPARDKGKR